MSPIVEILRLAEEKLASYIGVKYALLTSMGRTALVLSLKALGIGPNDEVVLPSFTCEVVVRAIRFCGARPMFADVAPQTFNVSYKEIKDKISRNTKAILFIHCYGQPADVDEIADIAKENGVPLIEDAAHSLGAEYHGKKVGRFGHFSIFSFSKNMNCSSGGALATNSSDLISKARETLQNMSTSVGSADHVGHSMKRGLVSFARRERALLSSLMLLDVSRLGITRKFMGYVSNRIPRVFSANEQIAVDVIKGLKDIDQKNRGRREKAHILTELLDDLKVDYVQPPLEKMDRIHVYYMYGLKVTNRNRMLKGLRRLEKRLVWGLPWRCQYGSVAKQLSEQLILFEMSPNIGENDLHLIVSTLRL